MTTVTERLNEWRAKTDAATEGPWKASHGDEIRTVPSFDLHRFDIMDERVATTDLLSADTEFIAASREAVPALLDSVEKVLALHTPTYPEDGPDVACNHCAFPGDDRAHTWVEWPCPTVAAITEALGVSDD